MANRTLPEQRVRRFVKPPAKAKKQAEKAPETPKVTPAPKESK